MAFYSLIYLLTQQISIEPTCARHCSSLWEHSGKQINSGLCLQGAYSGGGGWTLKSHTHTCKFYQVLWLKKKNKKHLAAVLEQERETQLSLSDQESSL